MSSLKPKKLHSCSDTGRTGAHGGRVAASSPQPHPLSGSTVETEKKPGQRLKCLAGPEKGGSRGKAGQKVAQAGGADGHLSGWPLAKFCPLNAQTSCMLGLSALCGIYGFLATGCLGAGLCPPVLSNTIHSQPLFLLFCTPSAAIGKALQECSPHGINTPCIAMFPALHCFLHCSNIPALGHASCPASMLPALH